MKYTYLVYNDVTQQFAVADSKDPTVRRTEFGSLDDALLIIEDRLKERKMTLLLSPDMPEKDIGYLRVKLSPRGLTLQLDSK